MAILNLSNREHFHKHCRFSFQHFRCRIHSYLLMWFPMPGQDFRRCEVRDMALIRCGWADSTGQCCEYPPSQRDERRHFSSESPNFGPNKCSITLHCWLKISLPRLVACVESTSGWRHLLFKSAGTVYGNY